MYKLYSIYDRVAGVYATPFLSANDASAIRYYRYTMSKSEMVAEDTALYVVGSMDQNTGVIVPGIQFLVNYVGDDINEEK